ncbi:MAG: phytase [Methylocystis sp.]|uniref:phytase n=1 Tax=Methylocystis sp. TaxID=1911079 RepID=UPI003DA5F6CC
MSSLLLRTLAVAIGATLSSTAIAQVIGPSTSTEPFVLPSINPGVVTKSILTAGDTVGNYRMVGIPDGIGVMNRSIGAFDLALNHELGRDKGIARSHGSTGAFVSRWTLDRSLKVTAGRDHIANQASLFLASNGQWVAGTTSFDRFCSADLAAPGAYSFGIFGTTNRIFLNGEETTPSSAADHGRVFAHVLTGPDANKSFQLPHLGRAAVENALASPFPQLKTIVMVSDDANRATGLTKASVCRTLGQTPCDEPPTELMMYVGMKQAAGNDIQRAGLVGGNLFGVRVRLPNGTPVAAEHKDYVFGTAAPAITTARFEPVSLGDVSAKSGVDIQDMLIDNGITQFIRIEDGAWDPRPGKQRDYYFVTTGRLDADPAKWRPSRLWRLRFDNISKPELGGEITMLLSNAYYPGATTTPNNDPGYQMFDNITIDRLGRIILLEDVGANERLGRVYAYGIDSGKLVQVAVHNPKFFSPSGAAFQTIDEESSGVVDAADILGPGWFLFDSQNHKASADLELVESGQLLALYVAPNIAR